MSTQARPDLTHALLDYWRNSLADEQRLQPRSVTRYIRREDVERGQLSSDDTIALFKEAEKPPQSQTGRPGPGSSPEPSSIHLVLTLLHAVPTQEHGQARSPQRGNREPRLLLCVPAALDVNGRLTPDEGQLPWIPRRYLEPTPDPLTIGSVSEMDAFSERHSAAGSDWRSLWACAQALLDTLTRSGPISTILANHRISLDPVAVTITETASGSTTHLLPLYDALRDHPPTALLRQYAAWGDSTPQPASPIELADDVHPGQMNAKYGLEPSQRTALRAMLGIGEGEILAVNGPPGTGKTTLLHAFVASHWIRAALSDADEPEPPILVVASSNNQAITNVIRSFGEPDPGEAALAGRWISGLRSYGLYCASAGKQNQTDFQILHPSFKQGDLVDLEAREQVRAARHEFTRRCGCWAGRSVSNVHEGTKLLRNALRVTVSQLEAGLQARRILNSAQAAIDDPAAYGSEDALRAHLAQLRETRAGAQRVKDQITERRTEVLRHVASEPLWLTLLAWLPPFARRRRYRDLRFLQSHELPIDLDIYDERAVFARFASELQAADAALSDVQERLERAERIEQSLEHAREAWRQWSRSQLGAAEDRSALIHLDQTLRHRAFQLATHYWEGRWILEANLGPIDASDPETHRQRLRRYAKLTPCFVSTLYMVPAFFCFQKDRLPVPAELIDVLILDEAGQVGPHVAGAAFALAKRAVVVGDHLQIPPVATLPESVDRGNLRAHGIARDEREENLVLAHTGHSASRGSALRIAQRTSLVQAPRASVPGMFLTEHWRCARSIIEYCNVLAYGGALEPRRADPENSPLPLWGYAHIPGRCEQKRGSRLNRTEAIAIAKWILDRRDALESRYGTDISKIVAVVTPFSAQADCIRDQLPKNLQTELTVGTVHRLQGAESPIVIFSSVYDHGVRPPYFFDNGKHLLNVAVSRARDSFLVFGDMRIFDPRAATPAGLLASFLFRHESNELTDVSYAPSPDLLQERSAYCSVTELSGTDDHTRELKRSLNAAQRNLWIATPYLSSRALEADGLVAEVREATSRGVAVTVYYAADLNLNERTHSERPVTRTARQWLDAAGATVKVSSRFHNKTLAVDDRVLIEGSFNWLSAERQPDGLFRRHERSLRGEGALGAMIESAVREMEELAAAHSASLD